MHPTGDELRRYCDGSLKNADRQREIADHAETCEFCAEFCERYRQLTEAAPPAPDEPLSDKLQELAANLYNAAVRSAIIDLRPLTGSAEPARSYMAADGSDPEQPGARNLVTLYSESPEVVLRVMRDSHAGGDYLQLLAEDNRLTDHVLIQLPELNREFVTDAHGRADIDLAQADEIEQLKWQIKMPDAVFSLQPLKYDPDSVEYAAEITLETDRQDRIDIRFEGKTEGKRLSVKVLTLNGRSDFGSVKVAVSQESSSSIVSAIPGKSVEFGTIDADTTINIHLYL